MRSWSAPHDDEGPAVHGPQHLNDVSTDEALSALSNFARTPNAIEEMTDAVTAIVQPLTGATAVCITVWDEERDILRALPGAFGAEGALHASITGPVSNPNSHAARVFTTGRPIMINTARRSPGLLQTYVELFHISRVMSVPLTAGSQRIGVLILVNKPAPFTAEDLAAAQEAAPAIAMAVELARWIERIRVRQRLEGILAATAVAIASGKDVEACLRPALDELGAVTHASVVGLFPREGAALVRRIEPPDETLEQRFAADAAGLAQGSAGAFPQAPGDPGWAALHAPVELYGERTAALSVLRRNGVPFGTDEAQAITRLASITALAWATEGYQHQLAVAARLRERERIADELHDRVAQILFAAQLGLDSMLERGPEAPVDVQRLVEIRGLLTRGDTAIRDVIRRLDAPADSSLERRLRVAVENVEEEFGVAVHVELPEGGEPLSVRKDIADCLVRVTREATTNAAKHAGPCRIGCTLRTPDPHKLVLTVVDDGLGIQDKKAGGSGHGLRALRRAVKDAGGTLRVSRADAAFGTSVTATFPLE